MEQEFRLESIELYNIFNYRGRHIIDFTPRRDGNIFLFDIKNGGGKTSLFLSIKWGFYGFDNDVRYEKDGVILGSQDFMNQDEHADGHFYVRIRFIYDGMKVMVHRACTNYASGSTSLSVTIDGRMFKDAVAQNELTKMVPPDYGDFFMFNGEILSDIANSQKDRRKTTGVLKLLGLKELSDLASVLKSVLTDMEGSYRDDISGDSNAADLKDAIAEKERSLENVRRDIPAAIEKRDKIDKDIRELENRREQLGDIEKLNQKIKEATTRKSELEGRINGNKKRFEIMSGKVFLIFIHQDLVSLKKRIDCDLRDVSSRLKTRRSVSSEYLDTQKRIIANHMLECPVCRSHLSDEQLESIKGLIDDSSQDYDPSYKRNKEKLDDLRVIGEVVSQALGEEPIDIIKLCDERFSLTEQLKETDRNLNDLEDVASASELDEYARLSRALQDLRREQPKARLNAEKMVRMEKAGKEALNKLVNELEKQVNLNNAQKKEKNRIEYTRKLLRSLNILIDSMKIRKRADILDKANMIFMSITNKPDVYKGLAYDDSDTFSMHIVRNDGERAYHPSSGEKHVLAISFLISLSLNTDRLTPMMMDTPLSRLDLEHKRNIAATLSGLKNQVLFLAQPGELDDDTRETFMPSVAKMFESKPDEDNIAHIEEVAL